MKVLQLNATGSAVKQWQIFLRGQGYLIDVSAVFDAETATATGAFQKKYLLGVDGVVGNQTFGQAALLGFELVNIVEKQTPFQTKPTFKPLTSNSERQQTFGPLECEPAPTPKNPEAIRITNDWEKNLVTVVIPQLIGIKGARADGKVRAHRLVLNQMLGVWAAF